MKNKKVIFILFPLLIVLTLVFSYIFSNKVKSDVNSQEYYYNITQKENFPKVNGTIYAMDLSEDGSILYVGGSFSQIGDIGGSGNVYNRSNLAAINTSDYSITTWVPEAGSEVRALQVSGSYIYIGGSFTSVNGTYTGGFARIGTDGVLDVTTCTPNIHSFSSGTYTVYDISIDSGYIYVAGNFNRIIDENTPVYGLVRLDSTACTWDSEWLPQPNGAVYDIEIYNGSIYIGGGFDYINDEYTGEFAKISPVDASVDFSCAPNIHKSEEIVYTVYDISITSEYIYVGGSFNKIIDISNEVNGLVRLENTNSCTWDSSWIPEVSQKLYLPSIYTISPVGEDVFVGGSFDYIGGEEDTEFALLDGDTGKVIQYWNPHIVFQDPTPIGTVYSSIVEGNDVYIGGSFNHVGHVFNPQGYGLTSYTFSYNPIPTIEIKSIEDLDNMRENLMANYVLIRDLDFTSCDSYNDCNNMTTYTTGEGWEPIGYYDEVTDSFVRYLGKFDGQGYTLSNLYINNTSESLSSGLFGIVGEGGEIKNLGIENVNISASYNIGALVGILQGRIENSYAKGSITGEECIGGLVGNQWMEGEVLELSTIRNSYSEASISGETDTGGLVGCNAGDVINSYSIGEVTGDYNVGGLIGSYQEGNIINSFWDTVTSGQADSNGGIGLTTSQMKDFMTYQDWDVVAMNSFDPSDPSVWYIDDGEDYPRLYWEYVGPEIETDTATNLTWVSATLNGELTSMDGESSVQLYFQYRKVGDVWSMSPQVSKTTTGTFAYNLGDLIKETQYEYRAVVSWRDVGTIYGDIKSFTTPALPPLPTVFGPVVSNIDDIQTPSNTEVPLL